MYLNEQKYEDSVELKNWMQRTSIFDKDLFDVLVLDYGCTCEEDIYEVITTKYKLDDIIRKVRVLRFEDIKETKSRQRLNKLLSKFEKIVKEKNFTKKKRKSMKYSHDDEPPQYQHTQQYLNSTVKGKKIKEWLRRNSIWIKELYDELLKEGYNDPDMIKFLNQTTFDRIIRKVRVERFINVNDQKVRNRLDKKLVNFEKLWKEAHFGNKKKKKKQSHSLSLFNYNNKNEINSKGRSNKRAH
eukprot:316436_1